MDIFEADYAGHNRKPKTDAQLGAEIEQRAAPDTIAALAQLEAALGVGEVTRLASERGVSRHELARRVARDGLPIMLGGAR
jgi:uncharacterized protein YidB (DUF937 family)